MSERLTWGTLPLTIRHLARWITIVQLVGYTTSLVYVWHTTNSSRAAAGHYRGRDPDASAAAMESRSPSPRCSRSPIRTCSAWP